MDQARKFRCSPLHALSVHVTNHAISKGTSDCDARRQIATVVDDCRLLFLRASSEILCGLSFRIHTMDCWTWGALRVWRDDPEKIDVIGGALGAGNF